MKIQPATALLRFEAQKYASYFTYIIGTEHTYILLYIYYRILPSPLGFCLRFVNTNLKQKNKIPIVISTISRFWSPTLTTFW